MSRNDVRIRLANGYNINFEILDHDFSVSLHNTHERNIGKKIFDLLRFCSNSVAKYNVIEQILEITRQYSPATVQCWMILLVPKKKKDIPIEPGDRISIKMAQSRLSAEVLHVQEVDSVDSRSLKLKFKNLSGSPRRNFPDSITINPLPSR